MISRRAVPEDWRYSSAHEWDEARKPGVAVQSMSTESGQAEDLGNEAKKPARTALTPRYTEKHEGPGSNLHLRRH